ncbi:MAG: sodium-dependent transporter [Kiritimatiellales bacterium]|jgi:NSS family neurotransmitter:Na+ symporter
MKENSTDPKRENWSGQLGFILAAAGSAIGLGSIWRFPYITGENGGGAFMLVYLLCCAAVGIPVMICEITLGRHTQRNPVGCFNQLTPPASLLAHFLGGGMVLTGVALLCFHAIGWGVTALLLGGLVFWKSWRIVGIMGVIAGFLILSYYSVIGGWAIGYVVKAASNQLTFETVAQAQTTYQNFIGSTGRVIGFHFVFMLLCVVIIYKGVQKGIETACKFMVPLLFVIMLVLILRALTLPGASAGVSFCFTPDFSKLTAQGVLVALGHAFFTLSLGMGAMITYGSYLGKNENIFASSVWITGLDTLVSVLSCLMIFPAVFAMGFEPGEGPGLVFQVVPAVFHRLPAGPLWGTLFFILLAVAALAAGISLLEVVTAYFVDEKKWTRHRAAIVTGFAIFLLGGLSAVSIENWDKLPAIQKAVAACFGGARASFFDLVDNLTCNWMLPLGGLFICLFTGWIWGTRKAIEEIRHGSKNFADVHLLALLAGLKDDPSHNSSTHPLTLASMWGIFVRFVCPVAILITFLHTIGWLNLTP